MFVINDSLCVTKTPVFVIACWWSDDQAVISFINVFVADKREQRRDVKVVKSDAKSGGWVSAKLKMGPHDQIYLQDWKVKRLKSAKVWVGCLNRKNWKWDHMIKLIAKILHHFTTVGPFCMKIGQIYSRTLILFVFNTRYIDLY